MNGEVKTYNLNAPMSWSMFRTLPDDIKRQYISGIRDRFSGPPITALSTATAQESPAEPPQQSQNVLSCPSGTLTFDGAADSVLGLLAGILGRSSVRLSVTWAALDDDGGLSVASDVKQETAKEE